MQGIDREIAKVSAKIDEVEEQITSTESKMRLTWDSLSAEDREYYGSIDRMRDDLREEKKHSERRKDSSAKRRLRC